MTVLLKPKKKQPQKAWPIKFSEGYQFRAIGPFQCNAGS